jgi:hypothetical protein
MSGTSRSTMSRQAAVRTTSRYFNVGMTDILIPVSSRTRGTKRLLSTLAAQDKLAENIPILSTQSDNPAMKREFNLKNAEASTTAIPTRRRARTSSVHEGTKASRTKGNKAAKLERKAVETSTKTLSNKPTKPKAPTTKKKQTKKVKTEPTPKGPFKEPIAWKSIWDIMEVQMFVRVQSQECMRVYCSTNIILINTLSNICISAAIYLSLHYLINQITQHLRAARNAPVDDMVPDADAETDIE